MKTMTIKRIILTTIVFSLLLAAGSSFAAEAKTFQITAKTYEFTPDPIEVNQGDTVRLSVTAIDKDHGFGIKSLDIDQTLAKGETSTIEFVADKKGEFTIGCTKFCGFGHFGMKAKLIVN
jgi:cytochrome c oxidase subunit 2